MDGTVNLTAPDLLVYEVANALNYNTKVSNQELTARVQDLLDLDLDLIQPSTEYTSRTASRARQLSISIYDASYITLSEIISANLVTADRRLHDKVSQKGQSYLLNELGRTWTLPK